VHRTIDQVPPDELAHLIVDSAVLRWCKEKIARRLRKERGVPVTGTITDRELEEAWEHAHND